MPTYETGNVPYRSEGGEKMGGYKKLWYLLKELEKGISVAVDLHVEMTKVLSEVNLRFDDLNEFLYKGDE
tara:strand:- start:4021 stop:4230 length:210 start_codon:yes stop_codon:yes gene_type:complete